MSAFNAFFAQLTGGAPVADAAQSSLAVNATGAGSAGGGGGAELGRRGNVTVVDGSGGSIGVGCEGSGGGGNSGSGGGGAEFFGIPLQGAFVSYEPGSDRERFGNPQCESVANLAEASRRRGLLDQGALVAANASFLCYSVKNSIRVIHRSTGARALIKLTGGRARGSPQDMSLLSVGEPPKEDSALLACSTSEGDVVVWELAVRSPGVSISGSSASSGVLEVATPVFLCVTGGRAQSVVWQPSRGRFLAVICGSVVVVCNVTSLNASAAARAVAGEVPTIDLGASDDELLPGAVCKGHYKQVTDASFSSNGAVLATTGTDGTVRLWETRVALLEAKPMPKLISLRTYFRAGPEESTLSRVLVMEVESGGGGGGGVKGPCLAVITGEEGNRCLKVWPVPSTGSSSGRGVSGTAPLSPGSPDGSINTVMSSGIRSCQTLSLPGSGALCLEADPAGKFVFAADTGEGLLYALHLAGGSNHGVSRMDYLRPYVLAHPVQSFTVLEQAPEPIYGYDEGPLFSDGDRILQLICVQTKPVQVYRITAREALPPPGLRALSRIHAAAISAASTSYRDLHGDVDSQVEADSVDDTDSNDDIDVDGSGLGGSGGRVGSNLKGSVTNANLDNSGDEADDAAAAVAMAAAERIFGEDEEDMEVLASDEAIGNIRNSISSTNSSSASSTSSLAVGKERCGASHKGGLGVAKREKKVDVTDEHLGAAASGGGSIMMPTSSLTAISMASETTATISESPGDGARALADNGDGGAGDGDGGGGSGGTVRTEMKSRDEGVAGMRGLNSAGGGADDRGSSRSSQQCTTPEGWEGAAEHDWDQDGSSSNGFDHIGNIGNIGGCRSGGAGGPGGGGVMNVNEHAAACATSAPVASIADSLSETSSSGGGGVTGEGACAPSTLASSSLSRRRQTATAPAAAASASPNAATISSTTNTPASIVKAIPPPVPARPARGWQQAVAAGGSNSPVLSSALPPPPATVAASNSKAIQEFSRFFSPHERRKFRGPSSAPSISSTGASASDGGEASGMPFRPSSGTSVMGTAAGEEGENLLLMVDADRDPSSEEQSVSVSVCEARQEVGATTNESAAFGSADGGASAGGSGGGLQATGGGVFSSSGEESTDASYQGGGEGGGGDGSGGVGAGEPSSSGISRLSAHGDASGGSAAVAITAAAAMQYQLGREADNSAGASPIVSRQHHHSSSASPGSLQATAPVAAAAGADTSSSMQNQHQLQHQQHKQQHKQQQQQQSSAAGTGAMVAPLSPTAVGEASRDQGAASKAYGMPLPGVTVDQSATLALRSLLMGGPGSGLGNSFGGGGEGAAGGGGVGETGSSSFWLSSVMRASGDGIPSAGDAGVEAAVGRARSDAEGAGAGIARPMPPSGKVPSEAPSSAYSPPRRLSAGTAAAPVSVPVSSSPPPSPSLSLPLSLPNKPSKLSTSSNASNVGGVTGTGTGGSSLPPIPTLAPIGNRGTPPGSSAARQKAISMPKAMLFAPTAPSSGPGLATAGKVLSGQQQQHHQQPQHPRRRVEEAAPAGAGSAGVMVSGAGGDGDGDDSGRVRVEVAETSLEDLVTAVAARVTAEMAGSMSELRASLQHTVAASCRQMMAEARGGFMAEEERNALLGDITASVDRTMRRGMAETVANPLAKLVVNTARQMVVDPLQASMSSLQGSISTLHGQQPRHVQAMAAAAAGGAQAGIQAVAQSQATTLATTAARAQAGIVRREVLECRDELSRSVADGVKEPVGIAFRESFEGQLIPRIQTAVQRMFEQINETLTRGLQASPLVNNRATDVADDVSHVRMRMDGLEAGMRDLTGALSTIGEKVNRLAELTLEMERVSTATAAAIVAQGEAQAQAQATQAAQAEAAAQSARSSGARAAEPAPVAVDPREELHHLLLAGRLEDAMNRALSASDLPLVMWLCGRLDPATTPAALPQHILVCLLQQLSASNLLDDTAAKLQWLQNCALAVDPSEPKIRTHLPLVLGQLKSALLSATPTIATRGGPDLNMVRLTTHVVNSLGLTSTMPSAATNNSGPRGGAAAGGGGGGGGGGIEGSGGMGGQ